MPRKLRLMAWLCVGMMLGVGCARAQDNYSEQTLDADPLERINRGVYQFNYAVDTVALRPVASLYREAVPVRGQAMASDFLANLYTPVVFANSIFQADPQNSFASLWRFLINSTLGVGGLFDVASEAGLRYRVTDFGQTLAVYGVGPGAYIVLPVIGPSNARDAVGRLADAFLNPFNYVDTGASLAMWSGTAVDKRAQNMKLIDDIYATSLDPYATFRSGYTQKRASDIRRAKTQRRQALEKSGFQ